MKEKWLIIAQSANFRAYNNLCGLTSIDEICKKYNNQKALQAARLYSISAYCLKRYADSK
jgi:hypothetical protein